MTAAAHRDLHAIVLAGGTGERLGHRSKADVELAGRRLLDVVLEGLAPLVGGTVVIVAPESVRVPAGVVRTLEDPPLGGPLAGVGAGMRSLARAGAAPGASPASAVVVCGVDTPGIGEIAPLLVGALARRPDSDGAVTLGGAPRPVRQYLQSVYRIDALAGALAAVGGLRHRGVRRVLAGLDLVEVRVPDDRCRDVDTPEDIAWWGRRLGAGGGPRRSPSWE
jgi:molybdopterin-guanine dinucleotide biosynthesis protein A